MLSVSDSESVILKFRFLCCQEQLLFLCDALNIIDLLDLLIFVAYAITRSLAIQQYGPERHFLISIMHKTRLLCVARLFKLCRHSRGLRLVFNIISTGMIWKKIWRGNLRGKSRPVHVCCPLNSVWYFWSFDREKCERLMKEY